MVAPSSVDPRAVARVRRRLAAADEPPWLHREVARRLAERLQVLRQPPGQWLDWGGFLGGGASEVARVWPQAQRVVVEPDADLLARSRAALRRPWWDWRGRRAADDAVVLETDVVPAAAGMLFANMVWHASDDPDALLGRWHRALTPRGVLMFATLGPDTLRELRAVYAARGWPAPHPPYIDMHDIGDALVQQGFDDPVMDQEVLRLNWSSPSALLAELRQWGGNIAVTRYAGMRTRAWLRALEASLAQAADPQGRIVMSIEVVYGHAVRGQRRAAVGEPVRVGLDELRSNLPSRRRQPNP